MVTERSRIPFGRAPDKGKPLGEASTSFLKWMTLTLRDTDFHEWAIEAQKVLKKRADGEASFQNEDNLEAQADAFLRNHGYGQLTRKISSVRRRHR